MKKVLIGVAVLAAIFAVTKMTAKPKANEQSTEITPESVFSIYNNRIVQDSVGRWFLIKDGKLYGYDDKEAEFFSTNQRWQAANPGVEIGIKIPISIWDYWSEHDQSKFGGTIQV